MAARTDPRDPTASARPAFADVGIVAALSIEVAPFVATLRDVRKYRGPRHTIVEGECGGRLVALIHSGPGRKAARQATQLLMEGHRPSWVVSAGFAGALSAELKRNDLVLATEIVEEETADRIAVDVRVDEGDSGPRAGRLITVDRIIRTAAEKAELGRRHDADIVDMETSAVARLCGERNQRFLSVRVVSDDAGSDLPPEILTILGRSGGYRVGAAVGAIWKRPSSVFDLLGLREHAMEAADRLAKALGEIVPRLS